MNNIYLGKNVIITGHTGFKGSWLSVWLKMLGANVIGIALDPYTNPSNFEVLVNDIAVELNYLGEEFDDDMIYVYMEVEGLVDISSLKIGNSVLFDVYDQQEHVIKIKTENKSKSFILTKYKPANVLKI